MSSSAVYGNDKSQMKTCEALVKCCGDAIVVVLLYHEQYVV